MPKKEIKNKKQKNKKRKTKQETRSKKNQKQDAENYSTLARFFPQINKTENQNDD